MSVISKRLCVATAGALGLSFASLAPAAIYNGNGQAGFGGALGKGSLAVTADGAGNVTFTLNNNGSFSGNDVVVYIDSVAGGFNNNSTFSDNGDGGREAVSATNDTNPSKVNITFPTAFGADYALEFENDTYDGLFALTSGSGFTYVTGVQPGTVSTDPTGGPYSVTFPLSDIGLTTGQGFSFVGDLISTTAYGSSELLGTGTTSDGTTLNNNPGFSGSVTFTAADTFGTPVAVPEPASLGLLGLLGGLGLRRKSR